MRSLWLVVTLALAAPAAHAGDFVPRKPAPAPAPVAKPRPRAKPVVTGRVDKKKSRAKQPRRAETWKRPMP